MTTTIDRMLKADIFVASRKPIYRDRSECVKIIESWTRGYNWVADRLDDFEETDLKSRWEVLRELILVGGLAGSGYNELELRCDPDGDEFGELINQFDEFFGEVGFSATSFWDSDGPSIEKYFKGFFEYWFIDNSQFDSKVSQMVKSEYARLCSTIEYNWANENNYEQSEIISDAQRRPVDLTGVEKICLDHLQVPSNLDSLLEQELLPLL